jgi:hypothetical protein
MQGPEEIERYRRMTVAERLRETLELMEIAEAVFDALPPDERARRFRIIEAQKASGDPADWRRAAAN